MGFKYFRDMDDDYCYSNYSPSEPKEDIKSGNPDPNNFKILKSKNIGKFVLLIVYYPDCINYNGNKILVFKESDITRWQLLNLKNLDPHFSEGKDVPSPIARFIPTNEGWETAKEMCLKLSNSKDSKK